MEIDDTPFDALIEIDKLAASEEYKNTDGVFHRIGGPALVRKDGTKEWFLNGRRHRIDGPAIIKPNGIKQWYVNSKNVTPLVEIWMIDNKVVWPWNEETQVLFELTWG